VESESSSAIASSPSLEEEPYEVGDQEQPKQKKVKKIKQKKNKHK